VRWRWCCHRVGERQSGAAATTADGGIGRPLQARHGFLVFFTRRRQLPLARQSSLRFRWSFYTRCAGGGGDWWCKCATSKWQRTRVDGVLHRPPIVYFTILIFSYYYILIVYYIIHARALSRHVITIHISRAHGWSVVFSLHSSRHRPQCHTAGDLQRISERGTTWLVFRARMGRMAVREYNIYIYLSNTHILP